MKERDREPAKERKEPLEKAQQAVPLPELEGLTAMQRSGWYLQGLQD